MAYTNEWTEWHLTPRGWEEGSKKTDAPKESILDPPTDRVLTYRYHEYMSSSFSTMDKGTTLVWGDPKSEEVQRLLAQYGPQPEAIDMRDWGFQQERQAREVRT